jgi:hypothetical protein
MSDEKCFCHFMGYRVKDAKAQKLIEENKDNVFEKNKGTRLKFWVGTEAEYSALEKYEENCLYLTTDDDTQSFLNGLQKQIDDTLSHFNKVLYEDVTGVATNGTDITAVGLTDYSLFAVTIHSTIANVTVLCSKTTKPTGGEIVSGFNVVDTSSKTLYSKFQAKITESGLSSISFKLTDTPDFATAESNFGLSVTKVVGIM